MNDRKPAATVIGRKPIPRGIAANGPAILSYGFRPFFLLAALFAASAMTLWIVAITAGLPIGESYGALNWHAHEMLFGYASAALAGFMLTAIPNWTGRLPVSGAPLLALVTLWVLGRIAMAVPDMFGLYGSVALDAAFLPALALIAGREIVAGKNWKNLKILAALTALSIANIAFHLAVLVTGDASVAIRLAVSIYIMLIAVVGGRIIPSFTRNWLVKAGSGRLPAPFDRVDIASLAVLLGGLTCWVIASEGWPTAVGAILAACAQAYRLSRWQGYRTIGEPILLVLHVAYSFIPIGLLGVGAAALGWLPLPSALHLLTVGVIGNMTFAVMTRASLGHTGRVVSASPLTSIAYLGLFLAAVLRPLAELVPQCYHLLLAISAGGWIFAFAAFALVYGPMLWTRKATRPTRA